MKILVVGGGGREHALSWALSKSPMASEIIVAPGNGGLTTNEFIRSVNIGPEDLDGLIDFALRESIGFVVVGPEVPLANGLVDRFSERGIPCFGPNAQAARLEASKAFSKDFMVRHGIPTARYKVVNTVSEALEHLWSIDYPVVIKASGLAAGKGVLIPENLNEAVWAVRAIMEDRCFGSAGDQIIIEEKLIGTEVSLMAFTDGKNIAMMPGSQDHKRLLEGDRGPNTGGMGAYAPATLLSPEQLNFVEEKVLRGAINGIRQEGATYVGVLYAGIMITQDGPVVLEYNCRFGDPETQSILPLLETDLLEICIACVEGRLDRVPISWKEGYTATVVMVSEGYPASFVKGRTITGLEQFNDSDTLVFHAGTRMDGENLVTSGGRVLSITKFAPTLEAALDETYRAVRCVSFEGSTYRTDIGHKSSVRCT